MKLLTALLLFLSYTASAQKISGSVLDLETKQPVQDCLVFLLERTNKSKNTFYGFDSVAIGKTNSRGYYSFQPNRPGKYAVLAEYLLPPVKFYDTTIQNTRIDIDSSIVFAKQDRMVRPLVLQITCKFDNTKNRLDCPKCKKTDLVLPIRYGLPVPTFDSSGNIIDNWSGVHSGGCVVDTHCNPTKYCSRCKLEF